MLPICRPDRLRVIAWTLASGTPLDTYDVDRLIDEDPSYPLSIEETSIDLRGDAGSAVRLDGLAVIHHDFAETTTLRLQIHSDMATWGGTTDIDMTIDVGPWLGRFAPHVFFDVATEEPIVADRTRQYVRLTNVDANNAPIKIGEIVVAGQLEYVDCGVGHDLSAPVTYGRSIAEGKKGPKFRHDRRTRDRRWVGKLSLDASDRTIFEGLWDQTYGVRPFLFWPLNDLTAEPIYGMFTEPTYNPTIVTIAHRDVEFPVEELSCGEAY